MKRLFFIVAGKIRFQGLSLFFTALLFSLVLLPGSFVFGQNKGVAKANREYIVLKVYHAATADQLSTIDQYLRTSLVPSLEKAGFRKMGVFTAINNDTAADKKMYVLIPFNNLEKLAQLSQLSEVTLLDTLKTKAYTKAAHNQPAFTRMETILLHAFAGMPQVKAPALKGAREERVYELRSYEAATEALYLNKVKMFNEGEVTLFERLGFNAVFYGQVLAGCRMPNLMYMTSFENKVARDEHWKSFGSDPEWKTMSALPQYQNNVSRIEITFLRPTAYSKL